MLTHFLIALGVSLVAIQVMVFSTTIYLHRSATHRALTLKLPSTLELGGRPRIYESIMTNAYLVLTLLDSYAL